MRFCLARRRLAELDFCTIDSLSTTRLALCPLALGPQRLDFSQKWAARFAWRLLFSKGRSKRRQQWPAAFIENDITHLVTTKRAIRLLAAINARPMG